jgi:hypothetical protein
VLGAAAGGSTRRVPIVNNSIFAELQGDQSAELRPEFRGGSSRTVSLPGASG